MMTVRIDERHRLGGIMKELKSSRSGYNGFISYYHYHKQNSARHQVSIPKSNHRHELYTTNRNLVSRNRDSSQITIIKPRLKALVRNTLATS